MRSWLRIIPLLAMLLGPVACRSGPAPADWRLTSSTATVTRGEMAEVVQLAGQVVMPNERVLTAGSYGGRVLEVTVSPGQAVQEGQVLMRLDTTTPDTAMDLVTRHIPGPTGKEKTTALLAAQEHLLSFGITAARDADHGCTVETMEHMKTLYASGDMKIRIYQMCSPGETAEHFWRIPEEARTGLFGDRYSIRSVKLMGDGSLGSGSAWLLEEYSDRPGHRGNPRYSDDEIYRLVREARRAGFQVNTHAIGDAAVRQALDAYERVLKEMPDPDHRYCIEHAEVVALEDIPRFAELGVLPSVQAIFTASDWSMSESRLGKGSRRITGVNAFRRFLDAGSILPNGTDSPVEPVNLFHSMYAAVTRMDLEGRPPGGWHPEECLTREEALRSHTIWAARARFEEACTGSIEAGKLADFVVVDRDYMNCPADEIRDMQVLRTVLGGETLYIRS